MKEFILALVVAAIGLSIFAWNNGHCVSDIRFDDVVGWKEVDGRYYAELQSGALEKVRYATYYERELRDFTYDVRICDGKIRSKSVNAWLTYGPMP